MNAHGGDHREALARTTLLIDQEWFAGEANHDAIADALIASAVRITADAESVSTRAGQTALITAFMLTARMGIGIELAVANVDVIDRVAPLRRGLLLDALIDLGGDLVPGARVRTDAGEVQETIAIGAAPGEASAVRVWAGETDAILRRRARLQRRATLRRPRRRRCRCPDRARGGAPPDRGRRGALGQTAPPVPRAAR
jgi:hypothetical protein